MLLWLFPRRTVAIVRRGKGGASGGVAEGSLGDFAEKNLGTD